MPGVHAGVDAGDGIATIYDAVRAACGLEPARVAASAVDDRPRLTEPWFCCAEPTGAQLGRLDPV